LQVARPPTLPPHPPTTPAPRPSPARTPQPSTSRAPPPPPVRSPPPSTSRGRKRRTSDDSIESVYGSFSIPNSPSYSPVPPSTSSAASSRPAKLAKINLDDLFSEEEEEQDFEVGANEEVGAAEEVPDSDVSVIGPTLPPPASSFVQIGASLAPLPHSPAPQPMSFFIVNETLSPAYSILPPRIYRPIPFVSAPPVSFPAPPIPIVPFTPLMFPTPPPPAVSSPFHPQAVFAATAMALGTAIEIQRFWADFIRRRQAEITFAPD